MVLFIYILKISSLKYSETFDENFSVSKITSLSFCWKYRAIKTQNKAVLLIQHYKKSCPQVKKKDQKLEQVLFICILNVYFNSQYFHASGHTLTSFYHGGKNSEF